MENGVYQLGDKIVNGSKGIEVRDGKGRGLRADSRVVRKSDGYLHDEYFWAPVAGDWSDLAAPQIAFLGSKGLSAVQEVVA